MVMCVYVHQLNAHQCVLVYIGELFFVIQVCVHMSRVNVDTIYLLYTHLIATLSFYFISFKMITYAFDYIHQKHIMDSKEEKPEQFI